MESCQRNLLAKLPFWDNYQILGELLGAFGQYYDNLETGEAKEHAKGENQRGYLSASGSGLEYSTESPHHQGGTF